MTLPVLYLTNGRRYRVLTKAGRMYEGVAWRAREMVFTSGRHRVTVDQVERIAERVALGVSGKYAPPGGETFVPVERCYLAKPAAL